MKEVATTMWWPEKTTRRRSIGGRRAVITAAAAGVGVVLAAAGCASSASSASTAQVPASASQTIVFATQGLGAEGTATATAVRAFENANPKIHVQILSLSPTSDVALQQLQQRFIANASTPDVVTTDVTWPATFAKPGWLANLSSFHPATASFFPGQMASGEYGGHVFAIPWFINAEGIYYRTDLIKTPPTTPQQLVTDAKSAMAKDPSLKEGLAFEADKYEGSVTAFQSFGGQIGASTLDNINTVANRRALTFMYDAVHTDKITPQAVSGWEESNVQSAWLAGQTPFALNWPYIFQLSEAKGSALAGKTGWIPFPNASGSPQASLGGDDLAVNARSTHQAAAWKFIQYLTSTQAQVARAISAGDPPSLRAAYNAQLYAAAPYYRQEQAVFKYATPRPVTPVYPQISSQLQTMLSSVISGQATPEAALAATGPAVEQLNKLAPASGS
jgi:trehalose/maltose transport system substrate-binding protein